MEEMPIDDEDSLLAPLCQSWLGVVDQCVQSKSQFSNVSGMCQQFYNGLTGFMWKDEFRTKYFNSPKISNPLFAVTINKAFELVAIFGPYLYWKYPTRSVRSYERTEIYPEVLGDPNDPTVQQMFEIVQQQMQSEDRVSRMRNGVIEQYLDYAQREQWGGGLEMHSQLAITDALICGRGCVWTESYRYPGSQQTLTGSFFDSVNNLLIDPDCTDPTLVDAQFIMRKHINTSWDLEKRFGLKKGSLLGKGTYESGKSQGGTLRRVSNRNANANKTNFDLIEWYEIYSKCGVGTRLNGAQIPFEERFDEVVGEYAYLCVAKGINFPLNAPPKKFKKATDEEVREMFDWPCPFWKDNRWPVTVLDFYRDQESCWPIPPLAAGLGELICMNILTSCVISETYDHSQQIIAVLRSAAEDVKAAITATTSPKVVTLNDDVHKTIAECIQYLQKPEINGDVWQTIDYLSMLFDKRTGLSELLYSMNPGGAQSRSAADSKIKQENASVRPDYMASQVAKWQTGIAELEKICAYWHVKARDVQPLLGKMGALMWERYVEQEDPDVVFREVRCTVEANDMKKPNKARDSENLSALGQYLIAELSKHADMTGDTGPLNAFIRLQGEAIEQNTSELEMGPRVPMPAPPEVQQMQQQQMELESQKLQADVMKAQADAQAVQQEAANAEQMLAVQMQQKQMELQFDSARGEQALQLEREKAGMQLQLEAAKSSQQMALEQAKAQQQMAVQAQQARQQQAVQGIQAVDKLTQSRMTHAQAMQQQREKQAIAKKAKPTGART